MAPEEPAFFADLNLDQVVASITAGRDEYDLKPFFYTPLRDVEAVRYRHEVLRDLEKEAVAATFRAFAQRMQGDTRHISCRSRPPLHIPEEELVRRCGRDLLRCGSHPQRRARVARPVISWPAGFPRVSLGNTRRPTRSRPSRRRPRT